MKVNSYATYENGGELKPYTYEMDDALPDDYVDVKVTHSGVCYTDIAVAKGEFGPVKLPLVGGHEVVGTVHRVGKNITHLKIGDRVGCHNVRSCCQSCSECVRGFNTICHKFDALATKDGGFGEYVRMQSFFVYPLPNDLPTPLMCAGATIWECLRNPQVKPGDRVAILGIGGLGHLGLKFARAFGCDVAAISTSRAKEVEAKEFGAHHYIVLGDQEDAKKYQSYFDYIIVTSPNEVDFAPLISLLRFNGAIILGGIPGQTVKYSPMFALYKGLKVISVAGCSRASQSEMIEFAAKHKIYPKIEVLPISKINEAFDKVKKNTQRYRMVLTF